MMAMVVADWSTYGYRGERKEEGSRREEGRRKEEG
jgi:hypothetical protein